MRKIQYANYFDKVFGCWIGKSISGTIGAPFEGRKELFDFAYDPRSIENLLPNDDLDLQVLWLEVMEKKGIYFDTVDLADAFLNQCPYAPGEYAVFKKNYKRGVRPPVSGKFNNSYYLNGMGCPIRSEIWGCISPGNPGLAKEFSLKDGIMDHGEESVWGEVFFAAMEAEAFFEDKIHKLIETGLFWIPQNCKVARLIREVSGWHKKGYDWKYTRELILINYGHPDCTNLYQNMGFVILALLYGRGDFIDTTMLALNCGFDTDCTCATVGAVLGIIYGAGYLMDKYGFTDTGYVLSVDAKRRSNLIMDLAEDTCRVGLTVAVNMNEETEITEVPDFIPVPSEKVTKQIDIDVEYNGLPAVGIGESVEVSIYITSHLKEPARGKISIKLPEYWEGSMDRLELELLPEEKNVKPLKITVPEDIERLYETNVISVSIKTDKEIEATYDFGIVGAAVWKMYGPFWENNITIPPIDYWDSYYAYIKGKNDDETADITRIYHLNNVVGIDRQYMPEPGLKPESSPAFVTPSLEGRLVNIHTDKFSVNDLLSFEGPCVVYLERNLCSSEDRIAGIHIGNTDAYKLWVNDILISESREPDWCTNENKHVMKVRLNKGVNRIVFKLIRRSFKADYSLIFCEGTPCTNHMTDFSSLNDFTK